MEWERLIDLLENTGIQIAEGSIGTIQELYAMSVRRIIAKGGFQLSISLIFFYILYRVFICVRNTDMTTVNNFGEEVDEAQFMYLILAICLLFNIVLFYSGFINLVAYEYEAVDELIRLIQIRK